MVSHKERRLQKRMEQLTGITLLALLAFIVCALLAILSTLSGVALAIQVFGYAALGSFAIFTITGVWAVINTFKLGE